MRLPFFWIGRILHTVRLAPKNGGRVEMGEQAPKIEHQAILQWAEGLYYYNNKGLSSEVLVHYDDEAG